MTVRGLPPASSSGPGARPGWFVRQRGSNVGLAAALLLALGIFLAVVNRHYPIAQWLAWRYLTVSALALVWAVSCLSAGYFLLDRLRISIATEDVRAVLAFPLGVFAFQTSLFLLGLAGLLGWATFVLVPVAFALSGASHLAVAGRSLREFAPPRTFPQLAVLLFGVGGAALVYFQILTPEAFSWDARWYHLPIAQQYALDGAVRRFPEGWWLAGYPHGASLLYTWAFLMPAGLLFDQLELCAHLEFVVFVGTIASIPTLVRQLVPNVRAEGAWAAMFLFPAIFLYDGNLCAGADHIAALWCMPVVLTLLRVWRRWQVRDALLFGLFMAAGVTAKFSAWSMLILPGLLFLARASWLAGASLARRRGSAALPAAMRSESQSEPRTGSGSVWQPTSLLAPVGACAAALLALSAQYWLRNWVWYGDPLYPVLHEHLRVRPWSPEAAASYRLFKSFTFPPAPGWQGVQDALAATLTFSFKPNDWAVLHRDVPVLGSLFTLSMLCLPFLRAPLRLWLTYLGVMVAIVAWYLTTHQDRYLQAWMPAMVACTVATLGLVWARRDRLLRGLVVVLVAAQIIWGADVPFFPTHNLLHDSPLRVVSNFIASGFLKTPNRLRLYGDEGLVAERLPKDAKLLVHESTLHLGFGVRAVSDQWQGRLSYAVLASPRAIHDELADMKVTHIGWQQKMSGWNSLGSNLAFLGFALNHGVAPEALGIYTIAGFPSVPPSAPFNDQVAMLGCGNPYPNGFYGVAQMVVPEPGQSPAAPRAPISDARAAVTEVGFVVLDVGCAANLAPGWEHQFHAPIERGGLRLYVRRR